MCIFLAQPADGRRGSGAKYDAGPSLYDTYDYVHVLCLCTAQSLQSTPVPSSELGPPHPHPQASVANPPLGSRGETHSLAWEGGKQFRRSDRPKVKYGVRYPKFIWAPVYSCNHWMRPPLGSNMYEGAIDRDTHSVTLCTLR
jgi:hypothetical protein